MAYPPPPATSFLASLLWLPFTICCWISKLHVFNYRKHKTQICELFFHKHSIPYETITAVTSDKYVIKILHLPPPPRPSKGSKGSILFLHGMFESAAMSLTHGTDSLPVLLAQQGYDVFLGNVRGNMYGLTPGKLSPWDNKFWDFSIREHAASDFPAMVDAILKTTKHAKLTAVYGTSQGALVSLMGIAKNPRLNNKIKLLVAVSPALVLRQPNNFLVKLVFGSDPSYLGARQYLCFATFTQIFVPDFVASFIAFLALAASGMAVREIDKKGASFVMASTPSGFLPTHSMRMYVDILKQGKAFYTGGRGSECDFKKVKVPIGVFMGRDDCVLDVDESVDLLRNHYGGDVVHEVVLDGWGHCDLWYSVDSKTVITEAVLELIDGYKEGEGEGEGEKGVPLDQSRVKVYWPEEKQYFSGTANSPSKNAKKITVVYDDGDEETLDMREERWKYE